MSYSLNLDHFVGKVAVVTGASSGIGKAIAEGLVKYGLIVCGLARRVERIKEHAEQLSSSGEPGRLVAFKTDLTKPNEIISTFETIAKDLGPIRILVNNAGVRLGTNLIDGDIDKWKTMLDTNLLGVAVASREAIANMKINNTKGHIINVNSVLGHLVADYPAVSMYPATKHALTAMTETLRLEINRAKLPIRITSLSPGRVLTKFRQVADGEDHVTSGLTSEDVADAAFYILATPEHVNVKELIISIQGEFA